MKITALKRQKKHLTLVSFEDGEILLDNDVCTDHSLKAGADISKEKAEEVKQEIEGAGGKAAVCQCNVADFDQFQAFIQKMID